MRTFVMPECSYFSYEFSVLYRYIITCTYFIGLGLCGVCRICVGDFLPAIDVVRVAIVCMLLRYALASMTIFMSWFLRGGGYSSCSVSPREACPSELLDTETSPVSERRYAS